MTSLLYFLGGYRTYYVGLHKGFTRFWQDLGSTGTDRSCLTPDPSLQQRRVATTGTCQLVVS